MNERQRDWGDEGRVRRCRRGKGTDEGRTGGRLFRGLVKQIKLREKDDVGDEKKIKDRKED